MEVIVLDVNENLHPPRFASFVHQCQVQENSPSGASVMVVAAHDDDTGLDGELQYFLRGGTGLAAFSINQDTGTGRWEGREGQVLGEDGAKGNQGLF